MHEDLGEAGEGQGDARGGPGFQGQSDRPDPGQGRQAFTVEGVAGLESLGVERRSRRSQGGPGGFGHIGRADQQHLAGLPGPERGPGERAVFAITASRHADQRGGGRVGIGPGGRPRPLVCSG